MFLSDLIRRSGRSLRSAKARTILTALAIAVGAFALTLTLAASNGATAFVNKIIAENFDPTELIVSNDESLFGAGDSSKPKEYDPSFGNSISNAGAPIQIKKITEEDITKIKAVEGVESVREDIVVNLEYITREGQKKFVGTVQAFSPSQKPELLAGSIPKPLDNKRLLLPEGYLEALGFKDAQSAIDQRVILAVSEPTTTPVAPTNPFAPQQVAPAPVTVTEEFTVAAVLKKPASSQPGTELYIFTGQEDAKRLNDITTQGTQDYRKYNFGYVKVEDGLNEDKLTKVQERLKELGYQAQSVKETQEFLLQIIQVLQGIVVAFGLIAIIASVFGIVNTMYISVVQRTREIGLMKALGMRKRDIGRLFRFEAAWIGLLGGLIGSLLAIGLGILLNPWITKQLSLGNGNSLLIFKPLEVVGLIIILIIVAIFAGWLPSRKAAKLDPIEALRTE